MTSILWRRLDTPGLEAARLDARLLRGTAVFEHESKPCRLDYRIACDDAWRTKTASVEGWVGERAIDLEITAREGLWLLNAVVQPQVAGCIDVDLNFSPSTNLLPIRRLNLAIGDEASARAAWLRFPSFSLEPLDQSYRRTGDRAYRYSSAGGSFTAELAVNEEGLVLDYPPAWASLSSRA